MDRMVWGHYTIYSMFSFFFPFSSLNSYKPTAGDGSGDNVEISSVFFSCFLFFYIYIYFLPFFVAFSSDPFFLLLQRT